MSWDSPTKRSPVSVPWAHEGWGWALHGHAGGRGEVVGEEAGHSFLGLFARAFIEQVLCVHTGYETDKHSCLRETG